MSQEHSGVGNNRCSNSEECRHLAVGVLGAIPLILSYRPISLFAMAPLVFPFVSTIRRRTLTKSRLRLFSKANSSHCNCIFFIYLGSDLKD